MYWIRLLLIAFLWSVTSILFSQSKPLTFTEFDLKNGLHVILHQNNSIPIVAINVMYHVGSKNEKPDRTGFAHFFEHLMFEGSDNIGRGQYDKLTQNAGGNNNAFTSFDKTSYFEQLPSNQLELGLWLESERMLHLKIDSIGVETQRKVVKEERRQRYENQPYGSINQELFANSFTVHPYRWVPIGESQYIDKATIGEFLDFYRQFYVPNNAVLVIAGDIQIAQAKLLVEKYFGDIPRGTIEIYRPHITEPKQNAERRKIVYDNIQLPAVIISYHMPAQGTADYYALSLLQNLLSSGKSSRFYKSLVDEQEIAVQTGTFPIALEEPGLFVAYAFANLGKNTADLEKAMLEEVENIKNEEISDKEFQKVRNQFETEFYTRNATMEGIALSLADYHLFFGNANVINTEIDQYNRVTKADLVRVAKTYLIPENRLVLYYLPKNQSANKEESL
jgi:predicted Zn-dependent peptidase